MSASGVASSKLSHSLRVGLSKTAGVSLVLAWCMVTSAQAQNQPAALSPDAAAAIEALTGHPPQQENTDPISRFLADKGLINTKPVVELAQQVRDKASDVAADLVMSAMNFLGVPYRRGGQSSQSGFDCSGFTRHVFENSIGLILPRRASEQAASPALVPVKQSELKPGDLVFFNTLRHTFSHVGIYVGDNKFIHSPRAGGEVRVEDMRLTYWQQRFDGARRAPPLVTARSGTAPTNTLP
ncbi:MAG: C40 family peptidase [Pseudomonadota bacterium]